ncbi:protein translocase subunit SecD [Nocardioides zeae]|uniref:Multifunctional fusion protein n=1 Tax=Nocardioides zeae TaxID=1457234 RepID=A0AAJ1TVG0_9ACTN|nr:protein translocase subunit SecD [Nocardioides zeae]MDQ1102719.1 SecD/SecF fusion protein [Nocardioides zeae]
MSRGIILRLLFVVALLAACAAAAWKIEPRLGIDLEGGSQITLTVLSDQAGEDPTAGEVDQVVEVLRQRVDGLGVSESTVVRSGSNRIIIELPGVENPDEALEVLGQTAQLEVRPVVRAFSQADTGTVPECADAAAAAREDGSADAEAQECAVTDEQGQALVVGPVALKGNDITGAAAEQPQNQVDWAVTVDFSGAGSDAFGELSKAAACAQNPANRIAILLDDEPISSPEVTIPCGGSITGSTQITGSFSQAEADDLAVLIEGGSLPLRIAGEADGQDIAPDVRTIGPTLGNSAIKSSAEAGIIGVALTGLFVIFVYRLVGLMATLALATYALISYAMLVFLGATLTLPGLAGFVLAIGLAIDANVLVFERAREEFAANRAAGLRRALQVGFNKAFTAILDSNVTTLLAAILLVFLASGPVQGFGVTLIIGTVASMISALVIARILTTAAVSSRWVNRNPKVTGLASVGRVRLWLERKNPRLIQRRKVFVLGSLTACIIAVAGIATQGLNLGLEFTGGRNVIYATEQSITPDRAREVIADAGFPEAVVQSADAGDISVRTGRISDAEEGQIREALDQEVGVSEVVSDDSLGAALGGELFRNAIIALVLALLAQMIYLAIRFKWTFGVAAALAMANDVVLVVGIFAWLGKPIDGVFLAAALTIIGLSINDTIVVFDRVREKWWATGQARKDRLAAAAEADAKAAEGGTVLTKKAAEVEDPNFVDVTNQAVLETLPRTVNTGIGSIFILAALTILGGDSLQDFALALLLGLLFGTASTTLLAGPLLTYFNQRSPFSRDKKERATRDPNDSGAVV